MGVRGAVLLLADAIHSLIPRASAAAGKKKILVVRLDGIGDFLLWLPSARAFRDLYPADRYELTLLAHPSWAALAREQALFDQVRALDIRRFVWDWTYRYRELVRVRRSGFSVLIQSRYSRDLLIEDALTRASGAQERVGFDRESNWETRLQKPISDRWYTRLVPVLPTGTMELERNAQFMRTLGLAGFRSSMPVLTVSKLPGAPPGRYYVLFPGAGWSGRQWPVERFAELAGLLFHQTGWTGVVCGGPDEAVLGKALLEGTDAPLENWAGRTSLSEMAALFVGAEIVITNETSSVHMAAAVGTPSVCVLGGGHYGRFVPYQMEDSGGKRALPLPVIAPMPCFGCDWRCIYPIRAGAPVPCIENVSVASVEAAVQGLLAHREVASARPSSA